MLYNADGDEHLATLRGYPWGDHWDGSRRAALRGCFFEPSALYFFVRAALPTGCVRHSICLVEHTGPRLRESKSGPQAATNPGKSARAGSFHRRRSFCRQNARCSEADSVLRWVKRHGHHALLPRPGGMGRRCGEVMNRGDVITRTVGSATESVTLPPINMNHLLTIRVEAGKVGGFHILPSVVAISSTRDTLRAARARWLMRPESGGRSRNQGYAASARPMPMTPLKLEWECSMPREAESLTTQQNPFTRKDGPRPRLSKQFILLTCSITSPVVRRSSCE